MPGVSALTEQKRQWLQNYKTETGCRRCGWNEHPEALEFHHLVESTKLFNLALSCATRSWAALFEEVAKCEVLCTRCHRLETANLRPTPLPPIESQRDSKVHVRKKRDHLWWLTDEEIDDIRKQLDALA